MPADPKAEGVEAAYVEFTRPACEAIKRQGVKRVVDMARRGRETPLADKARFATRES